LTLGGQLRIVRAMTIFVALPKNSSVNIDALVAQNWREESLKLESGAWLISTTGTTQEVAAKLGISEHGGPSVIIFSTTSYWGRAPSTVWEWMKAQLEAIPDG
jgi:hypothetical protein